MNNPKNKSFPVWIFPFLYALYWLKVLISYLINPKRTISDQEKPGNYMKTFLQRELKSTLSTWSADAWRKIIYFFTNFRWLEFRIWLANKEWSFLKTLTDFTQLGTKLDPILIIAIFTLSERKLDKGLCQIWAGLATDWSLFYWL